MEPSNDDRDTLACAEHAEALGEDATVRALAGEGYTGDLRAYVRACVERWRSCHDCGAVGGVQLHGDPHVAEYRCARCASEVEADRADHTDDAHCTVGPDDFCTGCGVHHGDPCGVCGGRGFHAEGCPEIG